MNQSRITGAVLLRLEDCASILSQHLAKLLHRPIRLRSVVEDYDYWCVVLENEYLSIAELRPLLCEISATEADFPDLLPDDSDRTRSFSMEFSRALLQHAMHASWGYEHLTEDYLILIDVDISPDMLLPAASRWTKSSPDIEINHNRAHGFSVRPIRL